MYDSCPAGCVYCYAVGSLERARANFARHDPDSPRLLD
jgi:DNA repair photolyase